MKKLFVIVAFVAAAALAKDRALTLREADLRAVDGRISVVEGKCYVIGIVDVAAPSTDIRAEPAQHQASDKLCATLKAAIIQAAKLDRGLSDAGL